jgi:hypothetical protein
VDLEKGDSEATQWPWTAYFGRAMKICFASEIPTKIASEMAELCFSVFFKCFSSVFQCFSKKKVCFSVFGEFLGLRRPDLKHNSQSQCVLEKG